MNPSRSRRRSTRLLLAAAVIAAVTVPLAAEAATSARAGYRSSSTPTPVSAVTGKAVHHVLAGAGLVGKRPSGAAGAEVLAAALLLLAALTPVAVRRRRRITVAGAVPAGTSARGPPLP